MPTYLSTPLFTAICFFAATFKASLVVGRASPLVLLLLAALWLGLLFAALRHGNVESSAFVAGILVLLGSGAVSRLVGPAVRLSPDVARVVLIDVVLLGLAVANVFVERRRLVMRPSSAGRMTAADEGI